VTLNQQVINEELNYTELLLLLLLLVCVFFKNLVTKLWDGLPRNGGSIPGGGKKFSFFQNLQTDSGANSASYSIGTWGCYAKEKKEPKREAANPPSCRSELNNDRRSTATNA
jgi:hypothetical protein